MFEFGFIVGAAVALAIVYAIRQIKANYVDE